MQYVEALIDKAAKICGSDSALADRLGIPRQNVYTSYLLADFAVVPTLTPCISSKALGASPEIQCYRLSR